MPAVDPSQVPIGSSVVARVTVASIVLSPSSARKNAVPIVTSAQRPVRFARPRSASPSSSPRWVQPAKPKKARPATTWIAAVGRASANAEPRRTEPAWTTSVAMVTATSTVMARYRAANASAISWLLSPSSASRITPVERRNASIRGSGAGLGSGSHAFDPTPVRWCRQSKVSSVRVRGPGDRARIRASMSIVRSRPTPLRRPWSGGSWPGVKWRPGDEATPVAHSSAPARVPDACASAGTFATRERRPAAEARAAVRHGEQD